MLINARAQCLTFLMFRSNVRLLMIRRILHKATNKMMEGQSMKWEEKLQNLYILKQKEKTVLSI